MEQFKLDEVNYSYENMKKKIEKSREVSLQNNKNSRMVKTLSLLEGDLLLDVGCSEGSLTFQMAKKMKKIVAIDSLKSSIDIAKEFNSSENITYEVRNVLEDKFPKSSFDCITFLETIEHVKNPGVFLEEFHRILKPNGFLILSTPNATSLKNIMYSLSYKKKQKRRELINDIKTEGKTSGTQLEHVCNWDFVTLIRLLDRCNFSHVDHAFVRSGPIMIPFLGKKIQIISKNSNILRKFETLMTDMIIKVKKIN